MSGSVGQGDIRPRVFCSVCKRSIAVTNNKRTGEKYIRSHVRKPGEKCPGNGRTYPAWWQLHYGKQPPTTQ